MFNLGAPEIIILLILALLVFGPNKLPEIGASLGRSIREFRKMSSEMTDGLTQEVQEVVQTVQEVTQEVKESVQEIQGAVSGEALTLSEAISSTSAELKDTLVSATDTGGEIAAASVQAATLQPSENILSPQPTEETTASAGSAPSAPVAEPATVETIDSVLAVYAPEAIYQEEQVEEGITPSTDVAPVAAMPAVEATSEASPPPPTKRRRTRKKPSGTTQPTTQDNAVPAATSQPIETGDKPQAVLGEPTANEPDRPPTLSAMTTTSLEAAQPSPGDVAAESTSALPDIVLPVTESTPAVRAFTEMMVLPISTPVAVQAVSEPASSTPQGSEAASPAPAVLKSQRRRHRKPQMVTSEPAP